MCITGAQLRSVLCYHVHPQECRPYMFLRVFACSLQDMQRAVERLRELGQVANGNSNLNGDRNNVTNGQ